MSHFDCSDAEGLDLGDRDDDVVANARRYMEQHDDAHSGEGDDMQDIDKMMGNTRAAGSEDQWVDEGDLYAMALNAVSALNETRLGALQNAIDLELRKRFDRHTQAAKAAKLAMDRKPPRATRKDAGRPRASKAANDVPRDEKGMAV